MSEAQVAWIERVLGIALSGRAAASRLGPDGPGPDAGRLATARTQLAALLPRLGELAKELPNQSAEIRRRCGQADAAVKASDAAGAQVHLDWLNALVANSRPAGAARPQAAAAGQVATARNWRDAYATWQDAKDTIDGQINALSSHLRRTNDKELIEIADKGLMRMTNDCFVPVRAAFMDFSMAKPADRLKVASEAIKRAAALRAQIESDERIAICEENPFGVEVTIRKTLIGALQGVVATLEQSVN